MFQTLSYVQTFLTKIFLLPSSAYCTDLALECEIANAVFIEIIFLSALCDVIFSFTRVDSCMTYGSNN